MPRRQAATHAIVTTTNEVPPQPVYLGDLPPTAPAVLPDTPRIAISPDGERVVVWGPRGAKIVLGDGTTHPLGDGPVEHVAAFSDDLWIVSSADGSAHWQLWRASWDGVILGQPVRLPFLGPVLDVATTTLGSPSMLLHGEASCEVRREGDAWVITDVATDGSRPVLIAARTWIERRGARLILRRAGVAHPLAAPAALVQGGMLLGGAALCGGGFAVVEIAGNEGRRLLVLDLRKRFLVRVLRLDHRCPLVFATRGGFAAGIRSGRRVVIIDLVRNVCVAEHDVEERIASLAVSARDGRIACVTRDESVVSFPGVVPAVAAAAA